MNRLVFASLPSIALLAAGGGAYADPATCSRTMSGVGRSSNVEGSADWKQYHGHVPKGVACVRAKSAWRLKVVRRCPTGSPHWWRARNKNVAEEGAAGHIYCTASAIPARKFLSLFKTR